MGLFCTLFCRAAGFILSPLPFCKGKGWEGRKQMDCFALKENGKCSVVNGGACEGKSCGFYKTKEEQERSLEKARGRLRSLPEHQQDAIADKYYGGVRKG